MFEAVKNTETGNARWLVNYYVARASFSAIWVGVAFAAGRSPSVLTGALLVAYPAWDAITNVYDARRNGGLKANPTQAFNAAVSAIVTLAVIFTLTNDTRFVLSVFGVWAFLSGALQLATGVRRWRALGGQWPMILSGAQSALAGIHFLVRAASGTMPSAAEIAPYAAFGALYFAIAATALTVSTVRRRRAMAA